MDKSWVFASPASALKTDVGETVDTWSGLVLGSVSVSATRRDTVNNRGSNRYLSENYTSGGATM